MTLSEEKRQSAEDMAAPPADDVDTPDEARGPPSHTDAEEEFPSTLVAATVMASCLISMFLVSLDRTILATAIPYITDTFNSIDDIGWYASAYMLTSCSLQLMYGKMYQLFPAKRVFIVAIVLFEIGSAVCGSAPTSTALIVGRAIAGAGSSGVMSGCMQIIVITVPLHKRPVYNAAFGMMFGISSVVGPLMGGALTQHASWRWCFYINLPCGAVSIASVLLLMRTRGPPKPPVSAQVLLQKLDLPGLVLFIPSICCLILALQWGGVVYPWSDGRVIAVLVVFGVTLTAWMGVQAWKREDATVPPRVFFQRTIASGFGYSFFFTSAIMLMLYYLPIWFQAIKGVSPVTSGIYTLPMVIAQTISTIGCGFLTSKVGYYNPAMITSGMIFSIGAGLITTFTPSTGSNLWIGYQFLCGFGAGMSMMQANLAAQAVLPKKDIPIGIALMFLGQLLGGAVFLAVGQSVFAQQLLKKASGIAGLSPEIIINSGATELRNIVPASSLPQVLSAYNSALVDLFYVALALSCAAIIPALTIEWRSIKGMKMGPGSGPGGKPPARPSEKTESAPPTSGTGNSNGTEKLGNRVRPEEAV